MSDFTIQAKVSQEGKILIANKQQWSDFLANNRGKTIIGEFKLFTGKEAVRQLAYLEYVTIPAIQKGFKELGDLRSTDNIIELLKSEYHKPIKELRDLSTIELTEFCKFVERYAAQNLDIFKNTKL